MNRLIIWCILTGAVSAAPMLSLSQSVVTVSAAIGTNAASQTLQASNAGDGMLSLSASVSPTVPWIAVSVGTSQACATCTAIQLTFSNTTLQVGTYTASVIVSDPNAVDSPKVVTVYLYLGGRFASGLDQYAAPGATVPLFAADLDCLPPYSQCPGAPYVATTADGGGWLTVQVTPQPPGGSIHYTTYVVELAPPANMAPGTYTGSVAVGSTGTTGPPSTYTVPVTMHLTTLPIAAPSASQISLHLAQNGPATTYPFLPYIALSNSGMGTLDVNGVSGSGSGVSAYNYNGLAIVTVDPASLAPGIYTDGLVSIQCNGANCPVQVPVTLEVDPRGPPIVNFQGAVDNATFSPSGAPGDVMVVKGQQLSLQPPQTASTTPLPTTLGGASVLVNGIAAPLFYSSIGQIAFQVPSKTSQGTALVQVVRDGQAGNTVSANMYQLAFPGIVVVTDSAYNLVDSTHPIKAGSTLVFWALGLGPTNPAVADGAVAPSPPAIATTPVTVQFGSNNAVEPSFVGLSPGSVGLYQVIATLPAGTSGMVSASLAAANLSSNMVTIAVQ